MVLHRLSRVVCTLSLLGILLVSTFAEAGPREVGHFGIVDRERGSSWDHWTDLSAGAYRLGFSTSDKVKTALLTATAPDGSKRTVVNRTNPAGYLEFELPQLVVDLRLDLTWDGKLADGHGK